MNKMNSLSELISPSNSLPALIIPDQSTISYSQLYTQVLSFKKSLAQIGLNAHDAVSIVLPNSYEFAVAFLAVSWQRAMAAPLNPAYKEDEFEFYIEDIKSVLIILPRGAFMQNNAAVRAARRHEIAMIECFWDGHVVMLDMKYPGNLTRKDNNMHHLAEPHDIALVLHTSGTTGKPKAVSVGVVVSFILSNIILKSLIGPFDSSKSNSINGFSTPLG